ncbi:UbiD family decarboxylase [Serratia marcescens]|nr:UbiD family decarboxylase [Serratia marcescens]MBH2865780.1 UbiD family decarboxylase [Serratia marcescens]MBW4239714.1 UbiD family decarboxylase [Enterobacter roggenkampii]
MVPHTLEGPATSRTVIAAPELLSELPVLRYAGDDPGPTVTLGLVYAWDSRTGRGNCSFHRITFKPCSIVVGIDSGGHLQKMIDTHTARGEHLPISVNIGLDPAIYIASVLTRPGVDYGYDELGAAGAIRGRSVNVAPCLTGRGRFIDHAEIVIEGSLGTAREPESPQPQGMSMPEYLGYRSPCGMAAVFEVQALSYRPGALYQTLSGPGFEQSALLGLGQECSVFAKLMAWQRTDLIRTVVAQPSGGGHLLTVLQVTKRSASDDEDVISLAKALLEAVSSLKNLLLVDEDVDPHSATEILWAMSTRARLDQDIHVTGPLPGNMLDPTQSAGYAPQDCDGFTKKSIIDCTVPYLQRRRFQRAFELRSAPSLPPV